MKNKLLVSVFAMAVAAFAFTSCETKSDVTAVCTDLVKQSLHKNPRSLVQLDGQTLTIVEYEFPGGVDDNRLTYRSISFGNGTFTPKAIDNQTYAYGDWSEHNTVYSLLVTPSAGDPYTLKYKGNAFITPDGKEIGGEGTNNTARVEKWEKTINNLPNTDWEAMYAGEYVMDSVFEDSIRSRFVPGQGIVVDTIKVFNGKMDTISADTTCYFNFDLKRSASLVNTGHFYKKSIRSTYNRETEKVDTISVTIKEYDFNWFFADVTSDAKFVIRLQSITPGVEGDNLSISKYKLDDAGQPAEFLLGGLTYTRPANP